MKTKLAKNIVAIIFFGSIWGLLEATLGYAFHFIPATISGMLMFPIANLILIKGYKRTGSRSSLVYMGFVAAAIKSVDFLLPGLSIFKTINPMISIVLEAMVVALVCPYLIGENKVKEYAGAIASSVGWRVMYMIYLVGMLVTTGNVGKYIGSFQSGFSFLIINGLISGMLAIGVLWINDKLENREVKGVEIKPAYALTTLVLAVFVQYLI